VLCVHASRRGLLAMRSLTRRLYSTTCRRRRLRYIPASREPILQKARGETDGRGEPSVPACLQTAPGDQCHDTHTHTDVRRSGRRWGGFVRPGSKFQAGGVLLGWPRGREKRNSQSTKSKNLIDSTTKTRKKATHVPRPTSINPRSLNIS